MLIQPSKSDKRFCSHCRDRLCRVRRFISKYIPLKTFHRNVSKIKKQQPAHRAERSCSLRPRKAVAFLTHLLRVPRSMGTGNFAVCGRRLRGHVPSKNTSPTALSWISLTNQTTSFLSVSARWVLIFAVRIFPYRVSIPRINPAFCATINACPKQTRILN